MSPNFKIICTSYKAARWLPRCLKSIAGQDYPHFQVMVADDASPGGVKSHEANLIRDFVDKAREGCGDPAKWGFITRSKNLDVLHSQHELIEASCPHDDDIIVIVDGDDFLIRPNSLSILAKHYNDDVWMTYGSYQPFPASRTCPPAIPFPQPIVKHNAFREYLLSGGATSFNHLRTYRYGLYRRIDPEVYFKRDGEWLRSGVDTAVMVSCLELAGTHHKVVRDRLLGYNSVNPLSYWRTKPQEVADADTYILTRPPLSPLESLRSPDEA